MGQRRRHTRLVGFGILVLWLLALVSTTGGMLLYRLVVEDGVSYGLPAAPIADRAVAQLGVNTRLELETPAGVTRSLRTGPSGGHPLDTPGVPVDRSGAAQGAIHVTRRPAAPPGTSTTTS